MKLKVKSSTSTLSLAGSIAKCVRGNDQCELSCIGAGAVNQGVKSIAIANEYLKGDLLHVSCVPSFEDVVIDNKKCSLITLKITVSDIE